MLNGIRGGTLTTVSFRLLYLYRLVQTQSIGTPDSKLIAILIAEGWDMIFSQFYSKCKSPLFSSNSTEPGFLLIGPFSKPALGSRNTVDVIRLSSFVWNNWIHSICVCIRLGSTMSSYELNCSIMYIWSMYYNVSAMATTCCHRNIYTFLL